MRFDEILQQARRMADRSEQELQDLAAHLRSRFQAGEAIDHLEADSYSLAAAVLFKRLGHLPYKVQLQAASRLDQGLVIQMLTGEGKTLTASLAAIHNAWSGQGVMVLAPNDYLAKRDYHYLKPVYDFLGFTSSLIEQDQKRSLKMEGYQADIIYTTNASFAFDYLSDQLVEGVDQQVVRIPRMVLIDEVDAILLDAAQNPLIISGAPRLQSNFYQQMNQLVATLKEGQDYEIDQEEAAVWLTEEGISYCQDYLGVDQLFVSLDQERLRHLYLALRAHSLFTKDRDYIVEDGQIQLVDFHNGRPLDMTRLEAGLHQALEVKEGLLASQETRAMASITYQELVRLIPKLAGMTGSAQGTAQEFKELYGLKLEKIPPNKPSIRKDHKPRIYSSLREKWQAILSKILEIHQAGNPLLIFTEDIPSAQFCSKMLWKQGVGNQLLTARHVAREASIISQAGQKYAVTVATAMAGRGTDIELGPGVVELGGLVVLATERLSNQRSDWQIRGRSGRQGNPGSSFCYLSLEDRLIRKWKGMADLEPAWASLEQVLSESQPSPQALGNSYLLQSDRAQAYSEERQQMNRWMTQEFGESFHQQRLIVTQERQELLEKEGSLQALIDPILDQVLDQVLEDRYFGSHQEVYRFVLDHFNQEAVAVDQLDLSASSLKAYFKEQVSLSLEERYQELHTASLIQHYQKVCLVKAMDQAWIDQVDYLQQLRVLHSPKEHRKQEVLLEFIKDARQGFEDMKKEGRMLMIKNLCLSHIEFNEKGQMILHFP